MYAFLPLAILGLAATGAVAQTPTSSSMPTSSSTTAAAQSTPSSFSAWVQELPSCAQACVKNSFHDVYASICGQNAYDSSNPNDLRCICKVRNGNGQMTHEAEREISCLTNNCMSLYSGQQHKKVLHDLRGYVDMCAPYNKYDAELATASISAWPGIISSVAAASSSGTYASFPYASTLVMGGVVGGMGLLGTLLIF